MKIRYLLFVSALVLFLPALALASDSRERGCKYKEQILEQKLVTARKHGNTPQVRGLEEALEGVRRYCTDGSLNARLDEKVQSKKEKVREREEELAEARSEGKSAKKIAKREKKLEEARIELLEAERAREELGAE